jgi:hypothetical protein
LQNEGFFNMAFVNISTIKTLADFPSPWDFPCDVRERRAIIPAAGARGRAGIAKPRP